MHCVHMYTFLCFNFHSWHIYGWPIFLGILVKNVRVCLSTDGSMCQYVGDKRDFKKTRGKARCIYFWISPSAENLNPIFFGLEGGYFGT